MTEPQQESWRDRLVKWVETQHGTAGWELKLENLIFSERTKILNEVRGLVEAKKKKLVRCDGFVKWGECHCLKCRDFMVESESLDDLLSKLTKLEEQQ